MDELLTNSPPVRQDAMASCLQSPVLLVRRSAMQSSKSDHPERPRWCFDHRIWLPGWLGFGSWMSLQGCGTTVQGAPTISWTTTESRVWWMITGEQAKGRRILTQVTL